MNFEKSILWTGGWDSTYRIVQLSHMDVNVQPIYVVDQDRASVKYELSAMKKILNLLKNSVDTKAHFKSLVVINRDDIPSDNEISNAYMHIKESVKIGSQYEWLACLALQYLGIEMGIEKPSGEYNGCVAAIEKLGKFKKVDDSFVVDQSASSLDCNKLFGNFSFPIVDITETEMVDNIRRWGG